MGFREFNPENASIPVRGPVGQALAEAIGAQQDAELASLRLAMLERFPSRCHNDALDALGRTMSIERYPGESHDSYRARLVAAWPTWQEAGAATSIEAQLAAYGLTATCYETPTFRAGPGDAQHLFWIVLNTGGVLDIGQMQLSSWVLGATTLGTNASAETVRAVKRIVLKWKAAWSYPVSVIVLLDGVQHLGMDTTLGDWVLGDGGEPVIHWPIGKLLGTKQTTLGAWVLGGYEV